MNRGTMPKQVTKPGGKAKPKGNQGNAKKKPKEKQGK